MSYVGWKWNSGITWIHWIYWICLAISTFCCASILRRSHRESDRGAGFGFGRNFHVGDSSAPNFRNFGSSNGSRSIPRKWAWRWLPTFFPKVDFSSKSCRKSIMAQALFLKFSVIPYSKRQLTKEWISTGLFTYLAVSQSLIIFGIKCFIYFFS